MLFRGCSAGAAAFAVVTKVGEGVAAHRCLVRSQPASRGDSEWIIMKRYVTNDNNTAAVCNLGVGRGASLWSSRLTVSRQWSAVACCGNRYATSPFMPDHLQTGYR